jgi:hypothetical protein
MLFAVDRFANVRSSADGGQGWQIIGALETPPEALLATSDGSLHAAVRGGKLLSSQDGGRSWSERFRFESP